MKITWAVPWKTLAIALAGVALLAFGWAREHRMLSDALRGKEASELALRGEIVAEQETSKSLKADAAKLLAENELIKEAYEQALKDAPGAEVESVEVLKTAPVRVAASPREAPAGSDPDHPPAPPRCDVPLKPAGAGGFSCPAGAGPALAPAQCVLASGDSGSFKIDEITLRTSKGNALLVGTAEFWRESPLPRSKLAAGKFSSALSDTSALAPPPEPRWGVEAAGLCTGAGCGLGVGALLPPFRVPLLGWRGEARAGVMAGPALAAYGALGVRF